MSKVVVTIQGSKVEAELGTTYEELARQFQSHYDQDIVLARVDGSIRELYKKIEKEEEISFLTIKDKEGRKAYRRSLTLLMQKAIANISHKQDHVLVEHSISGGYFCRLKEKSASESYLALVKEEMQRLCEAHLPIYKWNFSRDKALKMFHSWDMLDKERLISFRRSSRVTLYELDGYYDDYYGYMVPNTRYLKIFDLKPYEDGFMLLFPKKDRNEVEEFYPSKKLFSVLDESSKWGDMLHCGTLGALNEAITMGRSRELLLVQEALMEKKIGNIAEKIASDPEKKFIMIAGPSSSGKTTFSYRLSIQLWAQGIKPHPISLDDFYLEPDQCPIGEDGKPNFECMQALNIDLFNDVMQRLLRGEEVQMPKYNFQLGKSEKGSTLRLSPGEVLVIEGIHGLNDQLSYTLPSQSKYKIYISALTQLNIDEHNYLPTTDGRLIRRIVRDARVRNTSAERTIAMWDSVGQGEERYIFPYQEEADVMFNSALIYELAALKPYAEAQLFAIQPTSPQYEEAKRLLKFLDYVLPLVSEGIPNNSIIREFIGGSCFPV